MCNADIKVQENTLYGQESKFYWAERLMFNVKRNLKSFYSVDYCNEILSMSVLIILSPLTAFRKLANENVIEFFPFLRWLFWYVIQFLNYEATISKWLETKDIFISKMCSPLRQISSTLVIKISILPLNDWSCLRYFTNTYIVCVSPQCNENDWN